MLRISARNFIRAGARHVNRWRNRKSIIGSLKTRRAFELEQLESRLLLSADLAGIPSASMVNPASAPQVNAITHVVDSVKPGPASGMVQMAPISAGQSLSGQQIDNGLSLTVSANVSAGKADALWGRIGGFFTPPAQYAGDFGRYASVLNLPDGSRITTAEQWNQRRVEIRDYWLEQIGPWPAPIQHPRIVLDYGTTVSPEGITRHDIELETFPGTTSRSILLTPPGNGPFPAVLDVWYDAQQGAGVVPSVVDGHVDFAYQLAKRGFVALAMAEPSYHGDPETGLQRLSMLAYEANNAYNFLADQPIVNASDVGIVGHSFGAKWALFGGALTDNFAAVAVSDPGIVWDETDSNANYWEPWYLGYDVGAPAQRSPGIPTPDNPRTGAYKVLFESGHDLTELEALIAPRPFFVAGGSIDTLERWQPLNRDIELNQVLGYTDRVGMANRPSHYVDADTNQHITDFFDYFLNTAGPAAGPQWQDWASLNGVLTSGPDASSSGAGRLDVFVRGTDNALWHRSEDDGAWSAWESLGGVLTSDPAAVSGAAGRLDVFVRGIDNALWHKSYDGGWSGWESLGGVLTTGPDVASWGAGRLDVFVRGTDNALWHRSQDGGAWSAWESLGGVLTSDPAAVSGGAGRLDVFVRGTDNALWHKSYT